MKAQIASVSIAALLFTGVASIPSNGIAASDVPAKFEKAEKVEKKKLAKKSKKHRVKRFKSLDEITASVKLDKPTPKKIVLAPIEPQNTTPLQQQPIVPQTVTQTQVQPQPQTQPEPPQTDTYAWANGVLQRYGLNASVEYTDTMALCGGSGGCAIPGSGHIYLNNGLSQDAAGEHVLLHEYGHAVKGYTGGITKSGECAAEAFARATSGQNFWSYPQCAGILGQ